ncbi:hypothetical protein BH11ACT3_BH11ACT3_09940 [soil metagenome]
MNRIRTMGAASALATAALVLAVSTPASAATDYVSGSATCTGTRTGYMIVQGAGTLRVIQSFPGETASYWQSDYDLGAGGQVYVPGHLQSFSWQVIAQNGASYIDTAYDSCE